MFDTVDLHPSDPVAGISAGVEALRGEDRDHWPGSALSDRLIQLVELRERLDVEVTRLCGVWDRRRAWEADGALSAVSWLAYRAPISRPEARRLVQGARIVTDHPDFGTALSAGEITTGHLEALNRAATPRRRHLVAEHLDTLLGAAAVLSIDDFTVAAQRWAALADDQVTNTEAIHQHQRRGLHLSTTLGGMVLVDGALPADGGATVITALDRLAPPDPADCPDGPRSLSQRRHDALVDLAGRYLAGDTPSGTPATINVVVNADTLTTPTTGNRNIDLAAARCDLDRIGPIGRDTIKRLTCDGALSRVVMAGPSVVLDMGRRTRLATAAQRRALAIRDRHCVFAGCHRPPTGATSTTWLPGSKASDSPTSPTSSCYADATTSCATKAAGPSPDNPTAPSPPTHPEPGPSQDGQRPEPRSAAASSPTARRSSASAVSGSGAARTRRTSADPTITPSATWAAAAA
jgi:hypothetical protein